MDGWGRRDSARSAVSPGASRVGSVDSDGGMGMGRRFSGRGRLGSAQSGRMERVGSGGSGGVGVLFEE